MTSDEIETLRTDKLREINLKRDQLNEVCLKIHQLEKELVDLKESKRQGRHTLSILHTEEEILQSEYWKSKR